MTDKQLLVLNGLLELSETERNEVIKEAQGFKSKTFSEQKSLNESLLNAKRVMGPINSLSCPCCGR